MNAPLGRRLLALERAFGAPRVVYRVYSTGAEADADDAPAQGATVVQIITGVPRVTDTP